jgi:hypothetical protein
VLSVNRDREREREREREFILQPSDKKYILRNNIYINKVLKKSYFATALVQCPHVLQDVSQWGIILDYTFVIGC